jgi:hypothetical protein
LQLSFHSEEEGDRSRHNPRFIRLGPSPRCFALRSASSEWNPRFIRLGPTISPRERAHSPTNAWKTSREFRTKPDRSLPLLIATNSPKMPERSHYIASLKSKTIIINHKTHSKP